MALGGVVAAHALVSTSTTQALAMVAAAIIAPGFEPLAKLPLGLSLRDRGVLVRGLRSIVLGYGTILVAGAATMAVLDAAGNDMSERMLANRQVGELAGPTTVSLVVSACGALAGVVIISAYRLPLLPGPIVALHLIPATALIGMALAVGEGGLALEALGRLGLDALFILVAGLLVFTFKDRVTHRRSGRVRHTAADAG
jgi:uncharacterized membrane protein